ncbi:hypothetical protein [Actomonas aquatica]|uniref:Type II toxin-antitoxin system RelE/ParE family toxin n=1 Tax=Actomonas aquatica TaxID=2866162 RepID=A0ABZ1C9T7_9BACT|nr:hypothetical protein [Opitutus sp. WL0086]WRQ88296.1 hypothetical protein K1X11_002690 [Opitutus sp. WL0086]
MKPVKLLHEAETELWEAATYYEVDRFPFAVHYRVESDCIRVVAIAHGRQKPGYWRKRL